METLRIAAYSALICVGVPSNSLTLLVMSRRRLRGTSVSLLLRALAVCSTLALLFQLAPTLIGLALQLDPYSTSYFACTCVFFVCFTSGDVAVWIVPCVAADRVVAVFLPTRSRQICTVRNACLQLLALALLAVAKNAMLFGMQHLAEVADPAGNGTISIVCMWREEFLQVKNIRSYIATTLVAILPVAATLVLNGILLVGMRRRLRRVAGLTGAPKPAAGVSRASAAAPEDARAVRASIIVTQAVSAAFLVCMVPNFSYLTLQTIRPTADSVRVEETWLAEGLSLLYNANHVINFFLYVASSPTFRAELLELFALGRRCHRVA